MSTVRLRRLQSDYEKLQDYVRRHPRVKLVRAEGDPPASYQLEYNLRSLRMVNDELKKATEHLVEIVLPGSYPRLPPQCRMLTPIFHPNIAPHAICIGDHWSAGEPLWALVARIGEMIAYQTYNTKSPLNGEAARWVTDNVDRLPLDPVSMLVEEGRDAGPAPAAKPETAPRPAAAAKPVPAPKPAPSPAEDIPAVVPVQPADVRVVVCSQCHAKLRVGAASPGQRVRCPKCLSVTRVK